MNHFADPRVEWRISDIEQSLRGKASDSEVSKLNTDIDRLEHSNREICSQLQMLTDQVARMMDQLAELTESKS